MNRSFTGTAQSEQYWLLSQETGRTNPLRHEGGQTRQMCQVLGRAHTKRYIARC